MEDKNVTIAKIENKLIKEYGEIIEQDLDLYDFEGRVDSSITIEENYTIINEDFKLLYDKRLSEKKDKDMEEEAKQIYREENAEGNLYLSQNNFLLLGKKGSGKTCQAMDLMVKIALVSDRKAYMFCYPKPELLKSMPIGVSNITNMNKLYNLQKAVVLIDESHIVFPSMDKKVNEDLRNLLSISRQNDVCFIFVCHNSYFINRGLFSYIDVRIIKEVNPNHWELERNYMKKLYEDTHIFGKENFFIDSDYVRKADSFKKPEWFTDEFSNSYKTEITTSYTEELFKKLMKDKLRQDAQQSTKSPDTAKR